MTQFYGPDLYGDWTTYYGGLPLSALSANPMAAVEVAPRRVNVTWAYPTAPAVDAFRIVRNQVGYPDHEEDGAVLLHQDGLPHGVSSSSLVDFDIPLVPGRYAYYTAFIKVQGGWRRAGRTETLVAGRNDPKINYGTLTDEIYIDAAGGMDKVFLELLPHVFTNPLKDAIGPTEPGTVLNRFVSSLAMVTEDIRTLADLTLPSATKQDMPPGLLEAAFLQAGITPETGIPIVDQKRILRESPRITPMRGTLRGLNNYVEAMTGWAPNSSMSNNLLRYYSTATFDGSVGEWGMSDTPPGNTLTTTDCSTWLPPVDDTNWLTESAGLIEGQTGFIELPTGGWDIDPQDLPTLYRVQPATTYTFSAYFRPHYLATNSVAKTVGISVRGYPDARSTAPAAAWPTVTLWDPLTMEWKIDNPAFYPRTGTPTFQLPTGTCEWTRQSVTFNTGPDVAYVAFAIDWDGASSDFWAITAASLVAGSAPDEFQYPNSAIVEVEPSRSNLLPNPTFDSGSTTGWTLTGCTETSSTTVPPGVMTLTSLDLTSAGVWSLSGSAGTLPVLNDTALTGSSYVRGTVGTDVSATITATGTPTGEDTPVVLTNTSVTNTSANSIEIGGVEQADGVGTYFCPTDHGLSIGQSVQIAGTGTYLDGARTVTDVLSSTVFTALVSGTDMVLGPVECASATVTSTTDVPWVRPSVSVDLPAGEWDVEYQLSCDSPVSGLLVSASLLEKGPIEPGPYFDGDSPQQYGTEWRGGLTGTHSSVSDMYHGRVIKAVRLTQTIGEYVPSYAGAQVTSLGGALIAKQTPTSV